MKDNDKDINKLSEEGTRTSSDKNKNKNDIENTLINLPENENNKLKSNNNNLPNQKLKKDFKPIPVGEDNSIEFSKENYVIIKNNNFGSSKESELYKINDNKTKNENNKLDKINNNKIIIKINKKFKKKKYSYERGNNLTYYYLKFKSNYNIIINLNNEYSNIYESIIFEFFEIMVVNNKIKKLNFFNLKKTKIFNNMRGKIYKNSISNYTYFPLIVTNYKILTNINEHQENQIPIEDENIVNSDSYNNDSNFLIYEEQNSNQQNPHQENYNNLNNETTYQSTYISLHYNQNSSNILSRNNQMDNGPSNNENLNIFEEDYYYYQPENNVNGVYLD